MGTWLCIAIFTNIVGSKCEATSCTQETLNSLLTSSFLNNIKKPAKIIGGSQ